MKFIKKLLDIPIHYMAVIAVAAFLLIYLTIQGEITPTIASVIVIFAGLYMLQRYLGSVVIKTVLASFAILYFAALYTNTVMVIHGNLVEPFLLTIAAVTLFLSQTYNKNNMQYGIRSRALWATVLAFLLATIKTSFILVDYSFFITEIIGLNIFVVYTVLWRIWVINARKTKLNKPAIKKEEVIDNFKFIHIETKLNAKLSRWIGKEFTKKNSNAYPYIYSEVMKGKEEGLNVVFVYTENTDRLYDVEQIKINKAKVVPYMYIEAKDKKYLPSALEGFTEEISRDRD